ncbi:hypothetical protein ASO20_00755 [Mycoplasma sp. (ex Biomphalaria glabrata)]|uniref:ribonuclease J n=1 Tax=Mycoplasma sp. (ex Biomphalaria glabrata) TaxID=1749074 RepID=UPI00073A7595|nr:ribonuclease J [Mycoplasma sp. (ex Biomphalaria glabrata)]ALV23206.1 hypothetical protein ASO20_00755 [Mycoplasma sp. (ex Biomphalaria glabrata)]
MRIENEKIIENENDFETNLNLEKENKETHSKKQYKQNNNKISTIWTSLGGLQEVGKNMYCIEHEDELFIVDAGMKLPSKNELGIDCIIPDFSYLRRNQHRIKALIITHGHEDHIGCIYWLLTNVNINYIYAPKIAIHLIFAKLHDYEMKVKMPKIREISTKLKINTKHFHISFFRQNHSIPDAYGVALKTVNGTIVSTGDFKFDFTPLEEKASYYEMTRLGHEGVDILMSDSTNSMVDGVTISEQKVINAIRNIFVNASSRLIMSTFASNIWRVQQIIKVASEFDRKILVFGRSMEKIVKISNKINYIGDDIDTNNLIINSRAAKSLSPDKILILCTGSQGESNAALNRIANGTHKEIKLIPGDTIVFSSNPIPGNTYNVEILSNKLTRMGAKIIRNSAANSLHTSGHASKEEQKLMLNLIQPKHFCPVHGEYSMLVAHAKTAIECGVPTEKTFILSNGDQLHLLNKKVFVGKRIEAGDIYVDGKDLNNEKTSIIGDRTVMLNNGVIAVIVLLNQINNTLEKDPIFIKNGIKFNNEFDEQEVIETLKENLYEVLTDIRPTFQKIKNVIKESIANEIFKKTSHNPLIIPVVVSRKNTNKIESN